MKLTNELNLPQAVVEAVQAQNYTPGDCDISVTTLIGPPQIRILMESHEDELVEDISDRIWALMGHSIHNMLQTSRSNALVETFISAPIQVDRDTTDVIGDTSVVVGGHVDRFSLIDGVLDEYKMASVWEVIYGIKPEKVWQLAIYKHLLEEDTWSGYEVNRARLVFILRDWQMSKAGQDGYPKHQVVVVEPKLPSPEELLRYMRRQIHRHFALPAAQMNVDCAPEERWEVPATWAVMKEGNKKALKLTSSEDEAKAWIVNRTEERKNNPRAGKEKLSIQKRDGTWRRCMRNPTGRSYCPVADFCPQWKERQTIVSGG